MKGNTRHEGWMFLLRPGQPYLLAVASACFLVAPVLFVFIFILYWTFSPKPSGTSSLCMALVLDPICGAFVFLGGVIFPTKFPIFLVFGFLDRCYKYHSVKPSHSS